jgi:3-deoxy-D-manno-octulosonic-acid transferase
VRGISSTVYATVTSLAAPLLRRSLRRRARQGKEIAARLAERQGIESLPRPPGKLLWLHAASVGETVSILPVLQALPGNLTVLVSTGTVTSATLLQSRLREAPPAATVLHRFVPLDVPAWAARFLRHWQPDVAAFVESELWPNLIFAAAARGIPLFLLNARLSARSARNWRRAPGLARRLLGCFRLIAAQSQADAARFVALGAPSVESPGHLKFAASPLPHDATELARLQNLIGARPIWLAASTHAGEETMIRQAHEVLLGHETAALLIVAPRHPQRGAEVAAIFGGAPRRSLGQDPDGPVWIADTLGELGLFYRLSPIVFVGGSLVPQGGQNPLEPARLGCAIAYGPAMDNQAEAVDALRAAGAGTEVADAAALAEFVGTLIADPAHRDALGGAARRAASRDITLPARFAGMLAEAAGA